MPHVRVVAAAKFWLREQVPQHDRVQRGLEGLEAEHRLTATRRRSNGYTLTVLLVTHIVMISGTALIGLSTAAYWAGLLPPAA
ncbi:MAG: hypothetical protein AAF449_16845 [Myxococcota bacterium]